MSTTSQNPQSTSNSASSVVSTIAPTAALALVWFVLFVVLRRPFKRYYQPRTFLGSLRPEQRSPKLPDSLFGWIGTFVKTPDIYALNHSSLDSYLYLRFIKMAVVICVVGSIITMPVLFPVYATGGAGKSQLSIVTMSNVANYYRYFATAGCAMIFFGFVMWMITRESIFYINLRQAYLLSPLYASRVSSRTVLYTSVPETYMNERNLRMVLGDGVRRIWFAQDTEDLEDKLDDRDKAWQKLEKAETQLITTANKNRMKMEKKGHRSSSEEAAIGENGNIAMQYLKPKERPTHRTKFLIGKKVDTIDWARGELKTLIPEVDKMQASARNHEGKLLNSCFVEFETVAQAQAAFQSLTHHQALHMAPRFVGVTPAEVIWKNLRIKWWERVLRRIFVLATVCAMIIFWAIPVAAIGAISNINQLEQTSAFGWLRYIFDPMPSAIRGVITGLLPTVLLAILMSLVPIILRLLFKFSGAPTLSSAELSVQNGYFAFQVIQVFLVTTLGSAASAVGGQIAQNPASAVTILANNLPEASTFYLSYFVLQGLAIVSMTLVRITGLVISLVLSKLLDKTPRKMYQRWSQLATVSWCTLLPIYANLTCIACIYAPIAPLVTGFAAIGLFLFYIVYRYNVLFVNDSNIDTKGRLYPRALQHLFVGLYLGEATLIGLFAIATAGGKGALGPLILMIITLVFTALYQVSLNSALDPLLNYLPLTMNAEESRLLAEEDGNSKEYQHDVADKEGKSPAQHAVRAGGKKPNFLVKFLRPDKHENYHHMRRLVPRDVPIEYSQEDEQMAYYNPAITSFPPLLWIPRDQMGISRQEVRDTKPIIPITDEGAYLDDKGKIVWDSPDGRPPIYEEKPYY